MTDSVDRNIRQLVAEIVDAGPMAVEPPSIQSSSIDRGSRLRFALAAVMLALAAIAALVAIENRDLGLDTGPAEEQSVSPGDRYRYLVTSANGLSGSGEADLVNGLATFRLNLGSPPDQGADIEVVQNGDAVAARFSQPFAEGEIGSMPEVDYVRFYDVDPFRGNADQGTDRFSATFAEATKTLDGLNQELDSPVWVEAGSEPMNGADTLHLTAELQVSDGAEIFITNSLVGFAEIFDDWTGKADVWIRDDGLVARVVLVVDDSGQVDTVQLDYLDYGTETDIEWPEVLAAPPELIVSLGG